MTNNLENIRDFCLNDGGSVKMLGDIDPKDLLILENYGKQLIEYNDYKGAINIFTLLVRIDQWNGDYFYSLGHCYKEMGEDKEAIFCFSRSGIINSHDPRSAFYSAQIFIEMGQEELAIHAYKSVLAICKTYKKWGSYQTQSIEALMKLEEQE